MFLNTVSDTMPVTSDSPILGNHENENMENYEVYISPLPYLAVAVCNHLDIVSWKSDEVSNQIDPTTKLKTGFDKKVAIIALLIKYP